VVLYIKREEDKLIVYDKNKKILDFRDWLYLNKELLNVDDEKVKLFINSLLTFKEKEEKMFFKNKELNVIKCSFDLKKRKLFEKEFSKLKEELKEKDEELKNFVRENIFEFDIKPEIKYFFENEVSYDLKKLKKVAFDLEIWSDKVPNPNIDDIVLASFYGDNISKVLVYDKENKVDLKIVNKINKEKNFNYEIEFVNSQKEMIEKIIRILNEYDLIFSYNGDNFDFYFLKEKGKILNVNEELLKLIEIRGVKEKKANLRGKCHIDLFVFIKNLIANTLQSELLNLDSVSKEILGEEKEGNWKFIKDINYLIPYNFKDSYLTFKLAEHFLPIIIQLSKAVNQPIFEVSRSTYGKLVEYKLMVESKKYKQLIPVEPTFKEIQERERITYKGGFVYDVKFGFYENIAVLDFQSLYPSIIVTFNICPSTYDGFIELTKEEYQKLKENLDIKDLETETHYITPPIEFQGKFLRFKFRKDKKGFIPSVIKELLDKRVEIKKKYKEKKKEFEKIKEGLSKEEKRKWKEEIDFLYAEQYSLKILINAMYGYLGYSRARWFFLEGAMSITAFGRFFIKKVIELAEKKGFKVIYGDSVGKDTEIIIKENNRIKFVKIKDLFKEVHDYFGEKEVYYPKNIETLTINKEGKVIWKPIEAVIRHKTNKKIYRVYLTNTEFIDVTEDHSLITYINKRKKSKVSSFYERLREEKPINIKGKSLLSLSKIPINSTYKSVNEIDIFKDLLLWEFIGFLITDDSYGWQSKNGDYYLEISFGNDKEELENYFLKKLKEKDLIKNYYIKNNKGDFTIYAPKLAKILKKYFKEKNTKKIPSFILFLDQNIKKAFIRGLFSGDGSIIKRDNNYIIRLTNTNVDILKETQKILLSLGISSSIFKESNKNKFKGKMSNTYSYHLVVRNPYLFKEIGFSIKRKNERLKNVEVSKKYTEISKTDLSFRNIKSVEEIKYEDYVYDLKVKDTHLFFANNILVHNTDSLFITSESKEKLFEFLDFVNKEILPGIMKLDFEDFYKRGIFVPAKGEERGAKKKYALINENGELKIRGFETVRRDWSILAKEVQNKVIELILKGKEKEAVEFVRKVVENLKNKKVDKEKLVIYTQLRKELNEYDAEGPHVKLAKKLAERGIKVGKGSIIAYIVGKGSGNIKDRIYLPEEAKDYDENYYINNQIIPAVERIFEVLKINIKNELFGRQTNLLSFLKTKK